MHIRSDADFIILTREKNERFAVILAGDDEVRSSQMKNKMISDECPKQFCPVSGDKTLLTLTQNTIALKIGQKNIFYSLTKTHEKYFSRVLQKVPNKQKIIQPQNKGTAPAILYSLLRLSKINPKATVAFFPPDHYISKDLIFMNYVNRAYEAVSKESRAIVLLGTKSDSPNATYGWIETHEYSGLESDIKTKMVKRFWEKPNFREAQDLLANGLLWNSFVLVGKVKLLLALYKKHLPSLYKLFCLGYIVMGTYAERVTLETIYRIINDTNFSVDILEKSTKSLLLMPIEDVV